MFAKEFKSQSSSTWHFLQLPVNFCPKVQTFSTAPFPKQRQAVFILWGQKQSLMLVQNYIQNRVFCTVMLTVHAHFVTYSLFHSFLLFSFINTAILIILNPGQIFYRVQVHIFSDCIWWCSCHIFKLMSPRVPLETVWGKKKTNNNYLPGLKSASVQLPVSYFCDLLTYLLTYLLHGAESFLRS